MQPQTITLTTANNTKQLALDGPHQLEIGGTFGSGTLTPYGYSEALGQGAQLQIDGSPYSTAVKDSIICSAAYSQWVLSGSTGATVTIIATPIITPVAKS